MGRVADSIWTRRRLREKQRCGGVTNIEPRRQMILGTLDKGLHILEVLAGDDVSRGLTLTELSRLLAMHRTTLFRFLTTLHARGYVDRDPVTDRYTLGVRSLMLASSFLDNLEVRQVARPILTSLCEEKQELVHLTIMDNGEVVTIERVESKQPVALHTEVGVRRPAYCTAAGKAILAFLEPSGVDEILARGLPYITPHTITSPDVLRQQLVAVRRDGFAVDDGERVLEVRCAAAPVFNHEGEVLGAVSLAAPASRMTMGRLSEVGKEVAMAAGTISRRLGFLESSARVSAIVPDSVVST